MANSHKNILVCVKSVFNLDFSIVILDYYYTDYKPIFFVDIILKNHFEKYPYEVIFFNNPYDISKLKNCNVDFDEVLITDIDFPVNNYIYYRKFKNSRISIYSDGFITLKSIDLRGKIKKYLIKIVKAIKVRLTTNMWYTPFFLFDDARDSKRLLKYYVPDLFLKILDASKNKAYTTVPFSFIEKSELLDETTALFVLTDFNRSKLSIELIDLYIRSSLLKFINFNSKIKKVIVKPHLYFSHVRQDIFIDGITVKFEDAARSIQDVVNESSPKYIVGYDSTWLCLNALASDDFKVFSLVDDFFIYKLFDRVYFKPVFKDIFTKCGVTFIN